MPKEIEAVFDGTALFPEEPLNLAISARVCIVIESILPDESDLPRTFFERARPLKIEGAPDWSENIDQYLYGETVSDNE
ncbi:MAG: hypothetical protein AAGG51_28340 [Cyanobacteria bacterium P01_G01_bin.54]